MSSMSVVSWCLWVLGAALVKVFCMLQKLTLALYRTPVSVRVRGVLVSFTTLVRGWVVMPSVLLYVTTHLPDVHVQFLRLCWPRVFLEFTRFAFVHAHISVTRHVDANRSNQTRLPPLAFPHTLSEINISGKQEGAIQAMYDATARRLFAGYDWVVRLNPDVIVLDPMELRGLFRNRGVDVVLSSCGIRKRYYDWKWVKKMTGVSMPRPDVCTSRCTHRLVMSDFYAFRGSLNLSKTPSAGIAEDDVTELFKPFVAVGRDIWICSYSYVVSKCRIATSSVRHMHNSVDGCRAWAAVKQSGWAADPVY